MDSSPVRTLGRAAAPIVVALLGACGNLAVDGPAGDSGGGRDVGTSGRDAGESDVACEPEPDPVAPLRAQLPGGASLANPEAGELVLYELQVRSANACDPELGEDWQRRACRDAIRPDSWYRAVDTRCDDRELLRIRLGVLDDLLEDTDDPRRAVSLRYIDERVGANAVWLMPVFPNNDRRVLPDRCDNLGSPYAGRDYMHVAGTLSRACVAAGRDEHSEPPCWGDDALRAVLDEAHRRGMRVLVDVAMNHFGHDYLFYDTAGALPVQALSPAFDEAALWDFEATHDPALLAPVPLDSPEAVAARAEVDPHTRAADDAIGRLCPELDGQARIQAINLWRVAFEHERASWTCGAPPTLEAVLPGFYLSPRGSYARSASDTTSAYGWNDVKFLFHRGDAPADRAHYLRVREYVFRILNQLVAAGVDGFRLDHATDELSGMSPGEWAYVMAKVEHYAALRGQHAPIWLAEEFHDQQGMSAVADILTEGWLFAMASRDRPRTSTTVEAAIGSAWRFDGDARVMTALETHDELRLVEGTGLDPWAGWGLWSLGAASWSTPMLLTGQEWGESRRLAFRRSHVLRGRFEPRDDAARLTEAYRATIAARSVPALAGWGRRFLRAPGALGPRPGVVAMLRWGAEGDPVVAVHALWSEGREVELALPPDVMGGLGYAGCERVRLRDIVSDSALVGCREVESLSEGFGFWMRADQRFVWLAIERCGPGRGSVPKWRTPSTPDQSWRSR